MMRTSVPRVSSLAWMLMSLMFVSYCARAAVPSATLEQLVRDSDRIIVGIVLETIGTKIEEPSDGQLHIATIEVATALRGPSRGTVDIAYFPRSSVYPRFSAGDRVIVFLKRSLVDGRLYASAGPRGVVPMRGDMVKTSGISGQPNEQAASVFVAAIRAVLGQ